MELLRIISLFMLMLVVACVPTSDSDDTTADCTSQETFSSVSRSCVTAHTGSSPLGINETFTLSEDVEEGLVLNYFNVPSTEFATDYAISSLSPAVAGTSFTNSLTCGGGICITTLLTEPHQTGSFLITYNFSDDLGVVYGSTVTNVVNITSTNDAPTFCPISTLTADCGGHDCIYDKDVTDTISANDGLNFLINNFTYVAAPTAGVVYYDQASDVCRIGDGADWSNTHDDVKQCSFTTGVTATANCGVGVCTGAAAPVATSTAEAGYVYYDSTTEDCYISDGATWTDIDTLYTETDIQVLSVFEGTTTAVTLLNAYDVEDTSVTPTLDSDTSTNGTFTCTAGSCTYNPTDDDLNNYRESYLVTATDSSGGSDQLRVVLAVANLNDAPDVLNVTETGITEGTVMNYTVTFTNDDTVTTNTATDNSFVVDIDDSALFDMQFVSANGTSECLANGGGSLSDLDDSAIGDNIIKCHIQDKGLAVIDLSAIAGGGAGVDGVNAVGANFNVEFYPFPLFPLTGTETVTFQLQIADSNGGTDIGTGTYAFTYTANEGVASDDPPTFCPYTEDDNSAGACGDIDCYGAESPENLRINIYNEASFIFPSYGGADQDVGFAAGTALTTPVYTTDSATYATLNRTTSAVFYDTANDECFLADNINDIWVDVDTDNDPDTADNNSFTFHCPMSETSTAGDDCDGVSAGDVCFGAGSPATTGADTGAGVLDTSGLVYWDSNDTANDSHFACYYSDSALGTWNVIPYHWVLRTIENESGTETLTFDTDGISTTNPERSLPTAIDPEGDTITYTMGGASGGALTPTGCSTFNTGTGTDCTGFLPTRYETASNGLAYFDFTATDENSNARTIRIGVVVEEVDSSPTIAYIDGSALDGTSLTINEGAILQLYNLVIDEGQVSAFAVDANTEPNLTQDSGENDQQLQLTVTSSNPTVIDEGDIQFFWDEYADRKKIVLDNTGDPANGKCDLNAATGGPNNIEHNTTAGDCTTFVATEDAGSRYLMVRIPTVPGNSGVTNLVFTVNDGASTPTPATVSVTVTNNAVVHNGWKNAHGVGQYLEKSADPRHCREPAEYTYEEDLVATTPPTTIGEVLKITGNDADPAGCYESVEFPSSSSTFVWVPRGCDYSTTSSNCNNDHCIGTTAPEDNSDITNPPTVSNLSYVDITNNVCYISESGVGWNPLGRYAYLEWETFTYSSATAAGFKVFRKEPGEEFVFDSEVKDLTTATESDYTDVVTGLNSLNFEQGYQLHYLVLPYDSSGNLLFPQESFSSMNLALPPYNMVFVPRRVANKEICERLNATTINQASNNTCEYNSNNIAMGYEGTAGDPATLDIGTDLLVYRYEAGCDYTTALVDSDNTTECGGQACLSASATVAVEATETFYRRDTQVCTYGATMTAVSGANVPIEANAKLRLAKLPPITNINQSDAASICQQTLGNDGYIFNDETSATSEYGGDGTGTLDALSRQEQIILSAWDDDFSDTAIASLEQGLDLDVSAKCNSTNADGIDADFTDADIPLSAFSHTVPATKTSNIRSLATGSSFTRDCQSRYAVQDLVGNVREWAVDQVDDNLEGDDTTVTIISNSDLRVAEGLDPTNGFDINNLTGPDVNSGTCTATEWIIADETCSSNFFDIPMGLPLKLDNGVNIGSSSGITSSQLHGDKFRVIDTDATNHGFLYGGSYDPIGTDTTGSGNGRWTLEIEDQASSDSATGFRCILRNSLPADPNPYPN